VGPVAINCMSCQKPAGPNGKLFLQVFCCHECYRLAERFIESAERDLQRVRVTMREIVRQGLLQGKLQFRTETEAVSQAELLTQLAELAKKREATWSPQDTPPSGPSTKPPVESADS
jgi:hypothetical protein